MKHKDLVAAVSEKTGISQAQIENMISETIEEFTKALDGEGSIMISNFGTFEVRKKAERISFNPTTKERVLIPPKLALAFKSSDNLKETIENTKK